MIGKLCSLDRIVSVQPGVGATALRNVPQSLAIFDSHFPNRPVLPGVLVLGSMAELAKILLTEESGGEWRLTGADRVRYRHFIQPGDQMEIVVEIKESSAGQVVLAASVKVDGKLVTSVKALRMGSS
jgi:3-hydroxyacyl-[acyl-carrier-protein] dehydratase